MSNPLLQQGHLEPGGTWSHWSSSPYVNLESFLSILKTEMLQAPLGPLPFRKSISQLCFCCVARVRFLLWFFFYHSQFDHLPRRGAEPIYSYWELDKNFKLVALSTRFCCWKGSCSPAKLLADTAPRFSFSKNLNCSFQCSYSESYIHTPARAGVLPAMYF